MEVRYVDYAADKQRRCQLDSVGFSEEVNIRVFLDENGKPGQHSQSVVSGG